MNLSKSLGLYADSDAEKKQRERLQLYINLKLASSGQPTCAAPEDAEFMDVAHDLLQSYQEKSRLLSHHLCPADQRIQAFLDDYLQDLDLDETPRLPCNSIVLDRHGVARELSLPLGGNKFKSDIVTSYRIYQGVLHNPASDRRTTKGSFHVAQGGLPIPGDKKSVPKRVFANLLKEALNPPDELSLLPFSAKQPPGHRAHMFVSLLLRPLVCPAIPGKEAEKRMEIRFFAPGTLVSNLDFVESIFGNAGNPYLPEHDAGLDVDHWSGHSGCVILAPHLIQFTKKELGLPHWDDASELQRRDEMCWKDETERYNDGMAFKITARDTRGVIVTLIADNYYGYCKKEVKTQIGYAANLFGLAEEEHAGGALAFPARNHGEEFGVDSRTRSKRHSFSQVKQMFGDLMDIKPQGYGVSKEFPQLIFVPQEVRMDLNSQTISWEDKDGDQQSIPLRPGEIYMQPNGYKVEMRKHPGAPSWRLIGTDAIGTLCHKPSTVSGGGKSEISKSIDDAVIYGPIFVDNLAKDLDRVEEICAKDYSSRLKPEFADEDRDPTRGVLHPERSLGSVIRLLTPSSTYTDDYNAWLDTIPHRICALVFLVKRFHRQGWGDEWRKYFSVDVVDGQEGHQLKIFGRQAVASYLRVGLEEDEAWRIYKVRQDFIATEKIQMEDDITASVVVSASDVCGCAACPDEDGKVHSVKLVQNCENRLFQRPDEAIHRGFDKQTEADMAGPGNFVANFEPLKGKELDAIVNDVMGFSQYTPPMRKMLKKARKAGGYVVSSAHPRMVDGAPSKNPRYLQLRPDLANPIRRYAADLGTRFHRHIPLDKPVCHPVDAVLAGRRNNPPEPGIRPLAVYNPIHYQRLPELFMDFVCSLTGKSPSTTGAGSEGALTKGPFNALRTTADLNNALVSFILTGYAGFSSAAGYIGKDMRMDHDISLLIPEIWARLDKRDGDPDYLIEKGYLEACEDFEHNGEKVLGSRLGYRITEGFVHAYLGKIFDNPTAVFTQAMLKPESQDIDVYVDGINNIVEAQQRVAQRYLDDGSVEEACPPLHALLHIMAQGHFEGKDAHHPDIRHMFTKDYLLASGWYRERLQTKQQRDVALWQKHVSNLTAFLEKQSHADEADELGIAERLEQAGKKLEWVSSEDYLASLQGTIGADPLAPAYQQSGVMVQAA